MSAPAAAAGAAGGADGPVDDWAVLAHRAPQLAATMRHYLAQQAVTLAPRTIEAADGALRRFGLSSTSPATVGCWPMTPAGSGATASPAW